MPARVQRLHHLLELAHLVARRCRRRDSATSRREEAERVVAPVVAEPLVEQELVVDERVHRQQLDRGDAERRQVARSPARCASARVRAAQLLGHVGVQLREALDVRLVDHRVVTADVAAARRPPSRIADR